SGTAAAQAPAEPAPAAPLLPEAGPAAAPEAPSPAPAAPSPEDRLLDAVTDYQRGERERAQAKLVALVVDEGTLPVLVRQEARVYLGELLFAQDQKQEAQVFFEQVLASDPAYRLDPFVHPPDVCAFFDYVRALSADEPPAPPPPLPARMPAAVFSPLGTYHIRNGEKLRGYAYQVGILGTASASLLMGGVLLSDRRYLPGTAEEDQLRALKRAQIGVSAATWGLYLLSVSDASRHWRSLNLNAGPRGFSLEGRF
ncbi:MAG: hypothetical protein RL071_2820, partial [Pseudomonadota bacterium]